MAKKVTVEYDLAELTKLIAKDLGKPVGSLSVRAEVVLGHSDPMERDTPTPRFRSLVVTPKLPLDP